MHKYIDTFITRRLYYIIFRGYPSLCRMYSSLPVFLSERRKQNIKMLSVCGDMIRAKGRAE